MKSIEVTIDPIKLTGVYEGTPGYVSTHDLQGKLTYRRQATDEEALREQWVQRIEVVVVHLGNQLRGA